MPIIVRVLLCLLIAILIGAVALADQPALVGLQEIAGKEFTEKRLVYVEGTITYADPLWNFFFLQDGESAIFVYDQIVPRHAVGKRVRVRGRVDVGDLNPVIVADDFSIIGALAMPNPTSVRIENLEFGEYDCQYISTVGTVRQLFVGSEDALLHCVSDHPKKMFTIRIARQSGFPNPQRILGRRVRCTGCLGLELETPAYVVPGEQKAKISCFKIFCNSPDSIQPLDDKTLPPTPRNTRIPDLYSEKSSGNRFLTHGQISLISASGTPGKFVVFDDHAAIQCDVYSTNNLQQGMVLRLGGTYRDTGNGQRTPVADFLQPLNLSSLQRPISKTVSSAKTDISPFRRITITGTPKKLTSQGTDFLLELSDGKSSIDVLILPEAAESLSIVEPNLARKIRVTGVVMPATDLDGSAAWHVAVAQPEDLELLERSKAPTRRFLISLGGLLASITLAALWIKLLRSQVAIKTEEERRVSAQLRSSYDAIADGILAIDNQQQVLAVNTEFRRLCRRDVRTGEYIGDLHSTLAGRLRNESEFTQFWQESLEEKESSRTMEMELDSLEIDPTFVDVQMAPLQSDKNQEPFGHLLVLRDQTKNRKLQAELLHSNKLEAIGRLVGGVAHDFNNILTAVTANITLARMEEDSTVREVSEVLEIAEDAAFRGADIIRRLLTFSLRAKYTLEPHHINAIIERLRQLVCHTFDATFQFSFDLDEGNPIVKVEGTAVEQVLLNLYLNARDAMPTGGKIHTSTSTIHNPATNSDFVVVEVQDSGHGIAKEIRDKIFEPYFTTKAQNHGTGLGLSVSHSVIQQHDGMIQFENRPGGGSIFKILLPLNTESVQLEKNDRNKLPKGNSTILIVDDEDIVRRGAQMMLTRQGYRTVLASDGEEAIQRLVESTDGIDAVLLDLSMPGMPGAEVLQRVKQQWPNLPVVLCSGYLSDETPRIDGPDAIIPKPYSFRKLITTIADVTSSPGPSVKSTH